MSTCLIISAYVILISKHHVLHHELINSSVLRTLSTYRTSYRANQEKILRGTLYLPKNLRTRTSTPSLPTSTPEAPQQEKSDERHLGLPRQRDERCTPSHKSRGTERAQDDHPTTTTTTTRETGEARCLVSDGRQDDHPTTTTTTREKGEARRLASDGREDDLLTMMARPRRRRQ